MDIKVKIGILAGVLIGLVSFLIQYFNLIQNRLAGFTLFLIIVFASLTSVLALKKKLGTNASFGKLFAAGFGTTATTTVIAVFLILLTYKIHPSFREREVQEIINNGVKNGSTPTDAIEKAKEIDAHFFTIKSSQYLFPLMVTGAIFSVLGAAASLQKTRK
jgi:uncharacterized membrane protein